MAENPIVRALAERSRRAGSDAFLTWYRPETGARTELSVRSFANWVDKTANLLETLDVAGVVSGPVSAAHPGHWMSLIWPLAAWQRGLTYTPGREPGSGLVVVGPEGPKASPPAITLACSLHPFGLGLRDLPPGVLDYSGEALAEPDAHFALPAPAGAAAWQEAERRIGHAETGNVQPQADRVLVRPTLAWATLSAAILGPLLGGGSAVVVEGPVPAAELDRLAASERVTLRWHDGQSPRP